jgi:hypothetical protein
MIEATPMGRPLSHRILFMCLTVATTLCVAAPAARASEGWAVLRVEGEVMAL